MPHPPRRARPQSRARRPQSRRRRPRRDPRSNPTPANPSSLTIRPQYGSAPFREHFTSIDPATCRAADRASATDCAPFTVIRATFVPPSASVTIASARDAQADLTASSKSPSATGPARPLASRTTVSLVEQHPSTVISLKLAATARRRTPHRTSGSHSASVVSTASIVAMSGASIAAPFAIPPTEKPAPSTSTCFSNVSVVMIALAAAESASSPDPRPLTSFGIPVSTQSTGNGTPISPVWHTRILSRARPDSLRHELAHALSRSQPVRDPSGRWHSRSRRPHPRPVLPLSPGACD